MHVLWITENHPPRQGGMAVSSDRIVHGLRRAGVRVDVLHLDRRRQRLAPRVERRRGGVDVQASRSSDPGHDLRLAWLALENLYHDGQPSCVAAFGGTLPLTAGPPFAAWLDAPFTTLLRGNDFDVGLLHPRRAAIVERALRRSARVAVVSRDMQRRVRALFPSSRVEWIPNGIDTTDWKPLPSEEEHVRRWRQEVCGERRVIGVVGQIKQKKGVRFLLDALRTSGTADAWHVALTGEVDDEVTAWLTLHGPGIAHSAEPFGDRYGLIRRYLAADFVALPSFYDGLPNVLLEAAALGRPFLASTAGGMGDVLADERHGVLFAPGDMDACRRAIRRAADWTPEDLRRAGEACRVLVTDVLSAERETQRYLELLTFE